MRVAVIDSVYNIYFSNCQFAQICIIEFVDNAVCQFCGKVANCDTVLPHFIHAASIYLQNLWRFVAVS